MAVRQQDCVSGSCEMVALVCRVQWWRRERAGMSRAVSWVAEEELGLGEWEKGAGAEWLGGGPARWKGGAAETKMHWMERLMQFEQAGFCSSHCALG